MNPDQSFDHKGIIAQAGVFIQIFPSPIPDVFSCFVLAMFGFGYDDL
jgi:hypothetical protein